MMYNSSKISNCLLSIQSRISSMDNYQELSDVVMMYFSVNAISSDKGRTHYGQRNINSSYGKGSNHNNVSTGNNNKQ